MLTKSDLKAISAIVQTQIDESLGRELTPIKNDIGGLKKDMTSVKKALNRVAKDVKYVSRTFDTEIVHTRRRVEKIEEHIHLNDN